MNRNIKAIMLRLNELYKIYETHAWQTKTRKLQILYNDLSISFYLFDDKELIDELVLTFPKKEADLYKAISINLFVNVLGNAIIYKDDSNIYLNPYRKPYLQIIAADLELKTIFDSLIELQKEENITLETNLVKEVNKKVKNRRYDKEFFNQLDKRVDLSDKMLRSWDK